MAGCFYFIFFYFSPNDQNVRSNNNTLLHGETRISVPELFAHSQVLFSEVTYIISQIFVVSFYYRDKFPFKLYIESRKCPLKRSNTLNFHMYLFPIYTSYADFLNCYQSWKWPWKVLITWIFTSIAYNDANF